MPSVSLKSEPRAIRSPGPDKFEVLMGRFQDDPGQAKVRLLQLIESGMITPEQIGQAIATRLMVDDPRLALELLPKASFKSKYERLLIAKKASRRSGSLRLHVQHYLHYHAHRFVSNPLKYSKDLKSGESPRARLACWRAVRQYPKVLSMLKKSIRGKRVLLLGSGPSVKNVTRIPKDVVVVGMNRSPAHLATLDQQGGDLIWSVNHDIGESYWNHFQEIAKKLSTCKVVLLRCGIVKKGYRCGGPAAWEACLRREPSPFPTAFLWLEDLGITNSVGFDLSKYREARFFTNGMNMLRFILYSEPSEVYLAGMDLGYAGKEPSDFPYFHGSDEFRDVDGSKLKSCQHAAHPQDEMLMTDMSNHGFPIFSVSSDSKAADYFPVKELTD